MAKALALLAIIAATVSAMDGDLSPRTLRLSEAVKKISKKGQANYFPPDEGGMMDAAITTYSEPAEDDEGCPYESGGKPGFMVQGDDSYHCHFSLPLLPKSSGGRSCPKLQKERFDIANAFYEKSYSMFMEAAENMFLTSTYDKLKFLKTDVQGPQGRVPRETTTILEADTFELLDKYHIEILSQEDPEAVAMMKNVEDKILLKLFAQEEGIACTEEYYAAQISVYDRRKFRTALNDMCDKGVSGFLLKPTFLSWSAMLYKMFSWQAQCENGEREKSIKKVIKHAEQALCTTNRPSDGHLNLLTPGFTVESLFKTGGASNMPLEVKLLMLFGEPYIAFFIGTDDRGCDYGPGATNIYGDGTGWDFAGQAFDYGEAQIDSADATMHKFMTAVWPRLVKDAKTFAKAVGGDYLRFDAFIGDMDKAEADIKLELNEVENVSGAKYIYERFGLGAIWRDGYLRRKGEGEVPEMKMWAGNPMEDGTEDTWDDLWKQLIEDRNAHGLDSTPPPEGEPLLVEQCYDSLKAAQDNLDSLE